MSNTTKLYPIPDFTKYFSFDGGIIRCIKEDEWVVEHDPCTFNKQLFVWAIYAGPHCLSRYKDDEHGMAEQIANAHNGNKLLGMTDEQYNEALNEVQHTVVD